MRLFFQRRDHSCELKEKRRRGTRKMNASNAARDVVERPRDRLTVQILANGRPRFEEKSETTQKDEMIFEIRSVFVVVVVVVVVIKKEGSHRGRRAS